MKKISEQAGFQKAFATKESPESLKTFRDYCLNDQFVDKSCDNAKILAIKLRDQKTLIEILTKLKDEKALISEFEAMGEFGKAAHLLEKQHAGKKGGKFDLDFSLKIALFYEIDRKVDQRDRVLRSIVKWLKTQKTLDDARQALVYSTLNDAGMIDHKILALPWSLSKKMTIIHELELRGNGNKKTRGLMLSSKKSLGDKWSLAVLEKVFKAYEVQKIISFYGRGSERKFKKRISSLDKFVNLTKGYLEGSDLKTRVIMLELVSKAYREFYGQILATPLPEGLDEEQMAQVKIQLGDMASPYKLEETNYRNLSNEQLGQVEDVELKAKLSGELENYKVLYDEAPTYGNNVMELDYLTVNPSFEILKERPNEVSALNKIKEYFENGKQSRIANYFKGRILSL